MAYKRKYQAKSVEQKKAEIQTLTKGMEKSIERYYRTPEQMKDYLAFMAKFYKYSTQNISLIDNQFEGATAVGSFNFWKEKGFSVQKGEKGIQILVPTRTVPKFKAEDGKWKSINKASDEEKKKVEEGKLERQPGRLYFNIGHVFDISQTNATAKDLPQIFPNRWLEGDVKNYKALFKGMEAIAEKNGIKIIEPKRELGVAKGVSYTSTREVALNSRNSELQNVKTLLHELAHAKLHTKETHMNYSTPEKEFQAEMTAYAVSSYFGIDTSEYSLGYLASWTKGRELKDKVQLLKEVHETSVEFIETIESTLDKEIENIKGKEVDSMEKTEKLIQIQEKIGQETDKELGVDMEKHWEEYEIQLSEDGRVIENIYPNMQLSLGEMHAIVNKYGTETEKQNINEITETLTFYHELDEYEYPELVKEEVLKTPIAKVSSNKQVDMKVECISEYVKDNHQQFDFNNAISQTLNHINHSISESHKDIMNGNIEYQGLYPVDESEVIYCQSTGKPLQQDEGVLYKEGYGYVVAEAVNPKELEHEDAYYTTIEYESVEEKRLAPLQSQQEGKNYEEHRIDQPNLAPLVTLEALPDSKDEEVGRIHMMDADTKEIYDLTIWNLDKSNRDDLYINPMEKNGERDELYLDNMLEPELYKKFQNAIFENKGNQSFVVHQKNAIINLDQLVKDERYGSIVDKVEFQKNPMLSAKDIELYKEMKKEGYAPIKLIDEKIKTAEREVKNAYENYKYAQINETTESKQSIQKRSFAEEKYFETKIAAINGGFMEQVEVMKIEKSVDNKVDQLVYGKGRNDSEPKELNQRIPISKTEYKQPIGIDVGASEGRINDIPDKPKRNPVNRGRRKNEEEMER